MLRIFDLFSIFLNLKKTILLPFLCLLSISCFCQNDTASYLKNVLRNSKHDTTSISALTKLANLVVDDNPIRATQFLNQAKKITEKNINNITTQNFELRTNSKKIYLKKLATILDALAGIHEKNGENKKALMYYYKSLNIYNQIKDSNLIAFCLRRIGSVNESLGAISIAMNCYNRSLKISEECNNEMEMAKTLNNMALIYEDKGLIKEALSCFNRSSKILEKNGDKNLMGLLLNNVALLYSNHGQLKESINNFNQCLKIFEETNDKKGIAMTLNNMGMSLENKGLTREALNHFLRSLEIFEQIKNKNGIATSLSNLGAIYSDLNEFKKALNCYNRCLSIWEEMNHKKGIVIGSINISAIYISQNKLNEALKYGKKSLDLAKELGFPGQIEAAAFNLKLIYKKLNNTKKALEMFELYVIMHDSINNEENRKASYKSRLDYEYSKKAFADSISVIDQKKLAVARIEESVAKIKQTKTEQIALIVGLLIMIGFSSMLFNRFRKSQKQNEIIEFQKQLVDLSQKKIIDSINYAKKIQQSILPSSTEINKIFPEHFIFYKPKDIVSGDFYWFYHQNNISIFAVIDCTGHGVPGAFMTMIAHSALSEIVIQRKITSPPQILSNLHSLIFKTLQQNKGEEYSQDGMDVSIVVINHQEQSLQFSGARNNAYLIHDNCIQTLKATQQSIGGLSLLGEIEPERNFKIETSLLKKDTLLILATDGFFDQLNMNDEKFGLQRFSNIILDLSLSAPEKNLHTIQTAYENWIGNMPQLDDILVLGIKF